MNKKFLLLFGLALTLIVLSVFLWQSQFFIKSLSSKTKSSFIESKKNVGLLIAENVRRPLLVGDVNGAYRNLQIYRSKGFIDEFEIIENGQIIESSHFKFPSERTFVHDVPIFFNLDNKSIDSLWGKIRLYFYVSPLNALMKEVKLDLIQNVAFIFTLLIFFLSFVLFFLWKAYLALIPIMDKCIKKSELPGQSTFTNWVWSPLLSSLKLISSESIKLREEIEKERRLALTGRIAAQVSHDIRSPLAALNMAIRDISSIPEDKRIIIRGSVNRIQDIANELLAKNRNSKGSESIKSQGKNGPSTTQLVSSLLDSIITEKRMQFRSKLGIEIEFIPGTNSYGLFARIDTHGFKRVISNVINNSVEALGDTGRVQVELSGRNDKIEIKIQDNGKGIPPEILKRLGQLGETHGKDEGNGLGLYHAKKSIASWNGELSIDSEVGKGTLLTILLPKTDAPNWFVPELKLAQNGSIVILDDDTTIHQIWAGRFEKARLADFNIKIFHFSTADQIEEWVDRNKSISETVYLFDFELLGQKASGLDLIEKLNISKKAILVTSRYEEKSILEKCHKLGIKLIPKSMAESVPISMSAALRNETTNSLTISPSLYECVYIDDDKYLRMGWERSAKAKGIKLLSLSSTKDFEQHSSLISKEATFYIDRELGENEPKGEDWAKELYEKGYRNLYLATGYDASYFPPMKWISGFIEKEPPWESAAHT